MLGLSLFMVAKNMIYTFLWGGGAHFFLSTPCIKWWKTFSEPYPCFTLLDKWHLARIYKPSVRPSVSHPSVRPPARHLSVRIRVLSYNPRLISPALTNIGKKSIRSGYTCNYFRQDFFAICICNYVMKSSDSSRKWDTSIDLLHRV
jgi:hypothetical protein